jgi:hypothetical protein
VRRKFYVTESGVVVERRGPFDAVDFGTPMAKAPFRRVSTGGNHGVLVVARLRLATIEEATTAMDARERHADNARANRRMTSR